MNDTQEQVLFEVQDTMFKAMEFLRKNTSSMDQEEMFEAFSLHGQLESAIRMIALINKRK